MNIKTIESDEKFLRQKSLPVDYEKDDYQEYINQMKEFSSSHDMYAVSGIQLGIQKRIILLKHNGDNKVIDKILINPKIISQKGKGCFWESCISCQNKIGLVERPYEVEIEYYDENKNYQKEIFTGLDSTIICHEIDHLNGILFIDKAKELFEMNKYDRKEFRLKHPYKIINN